MTKQKPAHLNVLTLHDAVRALAKSEGISELETITLLQTGAAAIGDEATLAKLCELKLSYLPPHLQDIDTPSDEPL